MKVTLLNFCFEDYTVELANSLSKFVDLTLVQPESIYAQYKDLISSNIRVLPFQKFRIRDPRNLLAIRSMARAIEDSRPDILHVQETNDPWYDLFQITRRNLPLVTTIHDVFRHPGDRDLIPGSDLTRRAVISRSKQLIVHGAQQKDYFIGRFPRFRDQINVIPHGELGSLYVRCLQDETKIARTTNTLLFFGRIWPYKGLDYLLRAMPKVIESIPDVKLVIAGRGEDLEKYASTLSDRDHYTVLNHFIPMSEVTQLFMVCTAVVLPYIEASHSGVASIAFGLGTPIIASDVGGFRENIRHGEDGLLVPPRDEEALADAIIQLLSHPSLQADFQKAAIARSNSDLNWDYIAKDTIEVYQKVISNAAS